MARFSAYMDVDSSDEETGELLASDSDASPPPKGRRPGPAKPNRVVEDDSDSSDVGQSHSDQDSDGSSVASENAPRRNGRGRSVRSLTPSSSSPSASTSRAAAYDNFEDLRGSSRRNPAHAHVTDISLIPWAQQLGVESQRMHVMQAALFAGQQERPAPTGRRNLPWSSSNIPSLEPPLSRKHSRESEGGEGLKVVRPSFAHDIDPVPFRPSRKYARIERATSAAAGTEGAVVDAALSMGRSFRVGWGPGGSLVHLGRLCSPSSEGKTTASCPSVARSHIPYATPNATIRAKTLVTHHLQHTRIVPDANNIPFADPPPSLTFSSFASLFPQNQTPEASLFHLGKALFGRIDTHLPADAPAELVQRVNTLQRRMALSKWLENSVRSTVDAAIRQPSSAEAADIVFSHLTGHLVSPATTYATEHNLVYLAPLLAQIGGDAEFRAEIMEQLNAWRSERADAYIPAGVRRLYALLAGITGVLPGSGGTGTERCPDLRVDAGLDWKRAFGLRLWYSVPLDASVADAWTAYERAREEEDAVAPVPWYIENPPSRLRVPWKQRKPEAGQPAVEDALYALLRLYSNPELSLEELMTPLAFDLSPLDYSLPWHLYIIMSRVMRVRDFSDRGAVDEAEQDGEDEDEQVEGHSPSADLLANAYASQLEASGNIQEAAFVLLHLEGSHGREKAIKDFLARSAPLLDDWMSQVLITSLKIPAQWIFEAKAIHALCEDNATDAYELYLAANLYNEAHTIAIRDLAPEAVIRGDHMLLIEILDDLGRHEDEIQDWHTHGKVYQDWVVAIQQLKELRRRFADETNAVPDAADADTLERVARAVPHLLASLPGVLNDREDPRHRVALQEMVSALTTALDHVDPLALARLDLSSMTLDSSTALGHTEAAALARFEQAIAA